MKIKHPKEHDEIVQWILDNPETLLKYFGLKEPFPDLTKRIQVNVKNNKTIVGTFDVQFQLRYSSDYVNSFEKERIDNNKIVFDENWTNQLIDVNIIVNVKMESATEQLRELKKIYFQHIENMKKYSSYKQLCIIVSTNDKFKSFFTENGFLFYKV